MDMDLLGITMELLWNYFPSKCCYFKRIYSKHCSILMTKTYTLQPCVVKSFFKKNMSLTFTSFLPCQPWTAAFFSPKTSLLQKSISLKGCLLCSNFVVSRQMIGHFLPADRGMLIVLHCKWPAAHTSSCLVKLSCCGETCLNNFSS